MGWEGRKRRGGEGGGRRSEGERVGREGEREREGIWRGAESGLPRGLHWLSAGLSIGLAYISLR